MKNATLFEGIIVALIASFVGSVVYFALSSLFADSILIRLLISAITFAYLLYLLSRSKERIGRMTIITLYFVIVIAMWFFWPPISLFILAHLIAIWLVRSIYFYSSLLSSLADLALNSFSVAIAFWVVSHTGSLFLMLWCFFLTQALFVLIPSSIQPENSSDSANIDNDADFQRAYKVAQAAVHKLSSTQ